MRIVFDRQIYLGASSFDRLGELHPLPESGITAEALRDADVLIVRSVTRVDDALLEHSPVRFVGSVTAGLDHVDLKALAARNIRFAHAPGCNAESVSTYVASSLLNLANQGRLRVDGSRLGVIGRGAVGGRVARWAKAIGFTVVACDPPRQRAGEPGLHSIEAALECEVLTLHVPYDEQSEDATAGLLDAERLKRMPRGAWLIQTCRGGVVDEPALEEALVSGHLGGAIIDVWADEPRHRRSLAALAEIATPHIAGHSLDGKANGTWRVREALVRWLQEQGQPSSELPEDAKLPLGPNLAIPWDVDPVIAAAEGLSRMCDPWADTQAFQETLSKAPSQAEAFVLARRTYANRRDPSAARVRAQENFHTLLASFGFTDLTLNP